MLLMGSKSTQRWNQLTLPKLFEEPKQKLRNDIITFLETLDLKWQLNDVATVGEAFVKAIVDTLWLIDGVFKSKG